MIITSINILTMRIICYLFLTAFVFTGCQPNNSPFKEDGLDIQCIAGVKPRNVIFILADDHRYFMRFYGQSTR